MRAKSPTNCEAHLAESLFQTRSNSKRKDKIKTVLCFHEKKQRQTIRGRR
ncbi:MAG: DUF6783 domain-containing protein [Blautia faecis]|nr:DUF6783 domain-containing protein [Blautia faecis]